MEAPVRYVRSRDGTRIAYTVEGHGPPLLWLPATYASHVQLYPRLPGVRPFLADLSRRRTLIRIDFRGNDMSERDLADHSPEAMTDDLEAVADEVGLESTDIFTMGQRFMPAIRFAIRRPGFVRKMVFSIPVGAAPARRTEPGDVPGVFHLAETNWDLFLQSMAQRSTGRTVDETQDLVAFFRRCINQRDWLAEVAGTRPEEDWEIATRIEAPVLVIYRSSALATPDSTTAFANRFPNARLIHLPNGVSSPPFGDPTHFVEAIEEFLGPPEPAGGVSTKPKLTAREEEILALLASGKTEPEIAGHLSISPATVSRHVHNAYAKLGVHRKAEAVA